MKRVLIFGSLPPPVGGVRVFVKYLVTYFQANKYCVDVFPASFSLKKYDVAYINYSSPMKRLVASLIALFYSRRCIMVLHSSMFNMRNPFNFIAAWLCSGVVTTSERLSKGLAERFGCEKILFQSGLLYSEFLSERALSDGERDKPGKVVLFYQNNNDTVDGRSIYGADVMLEAVGCLASDIAVVWVDLSGEMERKVRGLSSVQYFSSPLAQDELFKGVDLLVRPTAFDGTAFMVVEALTRGVSVLCSDVVRRPEGVYTFSLQSTSAKSLAEYIESILSAGHKSHGVRLGNSIDGFMRFSFRD